MMNVEGIPFMDFAPAGAFHSCQFESSFLIPQISHVLVSASQSPCPAFFVSVYLFYRIFVLVVFVLVLTFQLSVSC